MTKVFKASFFMLALVAAAFVLLPAAHQAAAQAPTPYKCYQIFNTQPPQIPAVNLVTTFGEENVTVNAAQFLCEPALKNHEGDLSQTPYKAYAITDTHTPDVRVHLKTQFGIERNVLVGQAAFLWEPAIKIPPGQGNPGATPYKCYQISDNLHTPNVRVILQTQFGEENVLVGPAQYLCEPAVRNGQGDLEASPYKCYTITDTHIPGNEVQLVTYFGQPEPIVEQGVIVGPAQLLCDPAQRSVIPSAVGGLAELPDVASDSGWSTGTYAALAAGLAAAVLALTAGAWYARRRWVR